MIECYNQHLFELSDYIEFILTGYNSEIFDEFFELIWDCSADDVNEYKPCCADGDARPLSEQLLNKLRSRILSNA